MTGALVLLLATCAYAFVSHFRMTFARPSDIVVQNPALTVRDARALIAQRSEPNQLPVSLQLPKLRYAKVHEDHVDLVLARIQSARQSHEYPLNVRR